MSTRSERTGNQEAKSTIPKRKKQKGARQYRSKLDVSGKDPNYEYRWVKDKKEQGAEIKFRMENDWVLVKSDEVSGIGSDDIFQSEFGSGSIIRRPSGRDGVFYYLMKIRKEWYQEDQTEKQDRINKKEDAMFGKRGELYDSVAGAKANESLSGVEAVTQGKPKNF